MAISDHYHVMLFTIFKFNYLLHLTMKNGFINAMPVSWFYLYILFFSIQSHKYGGPMAVFSSSKLSVTSKSHRNIKYNKWRMHGTLNVGKQNNLLHSLDVRYEMNFFEPS